MGLGGRDGLHRPRAVHQHVRDEPGERTPALPHTEGGGDPGL